MSKIVFENLHLLQTLADKRLPFSVRKKLAKNLPEKALTALRETLFNVAVGNVEGFSSKIAEELRVSRHLLFKVVDANDKLSESAYETLISSTQILKFLEIVLPSILQVLNTNGE